jgi:penicillin amidase
VETARAALDELTSRLGPDATRWTWGAVHTISLRHPLHGRPGTDGLFATPPRPAHGTTHALNNNGYAHGARFDVTMGPELRMVVDMGDLDRFGVVLTTGQSGQPGSPHFADHLERWLTGEDFTLPWGAEAVEKAATGETRIEP